MINPTLNLYGLFVPAFLVMALAAWGCLKIAHVGLARIGFYKITVHPALTDLALYVLILTGLSALFIQ
ncbi:MAG: DUF1656 domain-containing protein [Thalassospira sp.]|jgi:hypothetical protein|uniref:DUF1656 domain-containing protein n=1 Tax=Thalassospira TaxID=168934 RepID=UPI000C0C6F9D|nr:DUF1656 domain-containing protein [Thalassospira sp. GB04J01]MBV16341.1 DUF1656 domain-containing protein [Thalassospira sp.]|tara:strand:+ start:287 stop:490 length:204 start_codon:yes stop_codon:yes gene_type:complete